METRSIGELEVSVVGLGCNNFGTRVDEATTHEIVDAALDAGVNFFDTADVYGAGASEQLLGRVLGKRRDQVLIATKVGGQMDGERGAHPDRVHRACEASLRRLRTDHIDLYQLHWPDPDVPISETLGALHELVEAGKVREVGHSNFSSEQIDEAEEVAAATGTIRFVSAQDEWSLLERDIEDGPLSSIRRHGLALLPYYPLAAGVLTGKYRRGVEPDPSWRVATQPPERREPQLADERLALVERLAAFAAERGRTLLELAMSWLANHDLVASVIAGATSAKQVGANATAVGWRLTEDDLAEIDRLTGRG